MTKLKSKTSFEDYLDAEKISPVRREFIDGEMRRMAASNDRHNLIAVSLLAMLTLHLRGSDCEPFFRDIKVQVLQNVVYYPDILVSCEPAVDSRYFRNDPKLIIEVTSPSTREIDHREKLLFYLKIASLKEYAVIDQHKMNVEVHRRQPNGDWMTYYFNDPDDVVELQSVDLSFPLPELYRRVKLDTNAGRFDDEE